LLNLAGRVEGINRSQRWEKKWPVCRGSGYGVGGRRGFLFIPEGLGRWGWLKFVGELQKAKEGLVATVG
jgi:hypothetical protein